MYRVGTAISRALREAQGSAPAWRDTIRAAAATVALVAVEQNRLRSSQLRQRLLREIEADLRSASQMESASAVQSLQKAHHKFMDAMMG